MRLHTFILVVFFVLPLFAQNQLKYELRTNGPKTQEAFSPLEQALFEATAVFYEQSFMKGRRPAFFGTVVSENGYVLTKSSEFQKAGVHKVRIGKTLYESVEEIARNDVWDIVLVKVEAKGLPVPVFAENSEVQNGTWVVANGAVTRKRRKVRVGVMSANSRMIGPAPVSIGVHLDEKSNELIVSEVLETGGAAEAGVEVGDQILKVGELAVANPKDLMEAFEDLVAGDSVQVTVSRKTDDDESKEIALEVTLKSLSEIYGNKPMDRNDAMSGRFSTRRHDFPRVLQHSVHATPRSIGGPLLLLDGSCIGMNIARFDRVTTYAIPVEELTKLAKEMISAQD